MHRIAYFTLLLAFASCEKCKECYLIEITAGVKTESSIGERCDAEIDRQLNHDLVCLSDDCYYECR
ncbi:MAG: hypothetical protein R2813_13680 [Flavobacteriales bacterium]